MPAKSCVVIDTNIALDLWVFKDPQTQALRDALEAQRLQWIATAVMREELSRVLLYPHIKQRIDLARLQCEQILGWFDAWVELRDIAPKAIYICKDPDDQKFIDLACSHQVALISKDKCVLKMKNRLQRLGVAVRSEWTTELA
jgi:putative PIN family toxin of toxin-antitoxin system